VINVYMKHYEQTDYACDAEIHPYQCPTKRLKHLQELSHGWQRDLSSSLVLLPSFFSTLLMKMVGQLSKRGPTDGRDGLVAGWQKQARGRTKSDGDVKLERIRGLVLAVSTEGIPLMVAAGLQRSTKTTRGRAGGAIRWWQHGAQHRSPREASTT
jgi:hypothetical protein